MLPLRISSIIQRKLLPQRIMCRMVQTIGDIIPKEVKIKSPKGYIAGKLWNESGKIPIIALHGSFDNAGSFDTLLPLLPATHSVLAIDLPGHGHSYHKAYGQPDVFFIEYLPTIHRVIKHFKYEKVVLLSHSMGAGSSIFYAGAMPSVVDKLIMLDFLMPPYIKPIDQPQITHNYLSKFLEFETKIKPLGSVYTYQEIVDRMILTYNNSLTEASAKILLKRGSKKIEEDKYVFTYDPFLKLTSHISGLLSINFELEKHFASKITADILVLIAKDGYDYPNKDNHDEIIEYYKKSSASFNLKVVEGTHHFHLNAPELIAPLIANFLINDS